MGNPGPETRLVKKMMEAVKGAYPAAFVQKIHGGPYQRSGLPDLLIIVEGRAVWLEVKAQKPGESAEAARNRTTALQHTAMGKIRRAGGTSTTVLTVEEVLRAVRFSISD